MVTLEALLADKKIFELTDLQIIQMFFEMNDLEEEGLNLISELTKSKIQKLKKKNQMVREWGTILPSDYLYKNYDLNIATQLHQMELDYLINGGSLSKGWLNWAKKNVPNILIPKVYFVELIKYLEENNISFKKEN